MNRTNSYMPPSKSQQHLTPDRVYDLIESRWGIKKEQLYDPCSPDTPYKSPCFFNGLWGKWKNVNYINPPFEVKTLTRFVEKALSQTEFGFISFMLLPSKTDQDWFHTHIVPRMNNVVWIRKRLKFKNNKDSSMGGHFLVMIE